MVRLVFSLMLLVVVLNQLLKSARERNIQERDLSDNGDEDLRSDKDIEKCCVLCGKPLVGADLSSEHVIHNAIGGIFEDTGIYCKECNIYFGTNEDKAFTAMFAPFVDSLGIKRTRKTKGTSYTGVMYDREGNQYRVRWKDKKTVEIKKEDGTYVGKTIPNDVKITSSSYDFNLDNEAFKRGLTKIAFNYAVHCGLEASDMERLIEDADDGKKKLVDKPLIFPFVPMSPFDAIMEASGPDKIFHALRLFNTGNHLFVYIELFSTFQYYVLVSEKCRKGIDKSYCNYIEERELENNEELLKGLTPSDYKDAQIIMTQYGISTDAVKNEVDEICNKEPDKERITVMLDTIGRYALREFRKRESYKCEYESVVNNLYYSIGFKEMLKSIMSVGSSNSELSDEERQEAIENSSEFMSAFQFYTIYEKDCVDIRKYKRYLPDGSDYPEAIYRMLLNDEDIRAFTFSKFSMLDRRMNVEHNNKKLVGEYRK